MSNFQKYISISLIGFIFCLSLFINLIFKNIWIQQSMGAILTGYIFIVIILAINEAICFGYFALISPKKKMLEDERDQDIRKIGSVFSNYCYSFVLILSSLTLFIRPDAFSDISPLFIIFAFCNLLVFCVTILERLFITMMAIKDMRS